MAEHGVVDRQDRTAGITEQHIDAFVSQHLYDDIRTAQVLSCERVTRDARFGIGGEGWLQQWHVH